MVCRQRSKLGVFGAILGIAGAAIAPWVPAIADGPLVAPATQVPMVIPASLLPLAQVPGIVPPVEPICDGALGNAIGNILTSMNSALSQCGGFAGGAGGIEAIIAGGAKAIEAGKAKAAAAGPKSKLDVIQEVFGSGGAGAGQKGCGSAEMQDIDKLGCTSLKTKGLVEGLIAEAEAAAKCRDQALAQSECALNAIQAAAGALQDVGAQVCGPMLDTYLTAAQVSAAIRAQIIEERKGQLEAVSAKLSKIQDAGKLIQEKQRLVKAQAEQARKNANNIKIRRAALPAAREHYKLALVMQCLQTDAIPALKCNPNDPASPSLSAKDYLEQCWFNRLSSTGNIKGEAGGGKTKRIGAVAQAQTWLKGLFNKSPAANATYNVETMGREAQVVGALPNSGISTLGELRTYISGYANPKAGSYTLPIGSALLTAVKSCYESSTIESAVNDKWTPVGKQILADEEDMLRQSKDALTDVGYTHNQLSTFIQGQSGRIDTTSCDNAKQIESVQACLDTYEKNLKQFLTGQDPLTQYNVQRMPDGSTRMVATSAPNPFAQIQLAFPPGDRTLAALIIPPQDAVNGRCRGVDDCNARLLKLKDFAAGEIKSAEADRKKVTQLFQAVATRFKNKVTDAVSKATSQLKAALAAYGGAFAKAGIGASIAIKNLDANGKLEMSGSPPSDGVPPPGQNLREIFQSGAGLLDPNSIKAEDLAKERKEVAEAFANLTRQKKALRGELEKCVKDDAEKIVKSAVEELNLDCLTTLVKEDDANTYKTQLGQLLGDLRRANILSGPLSDELKALDRALRNGSTFNFDPKGVVKTSPIASACPKNVNDGPVKDFISKLGGLSSTLDAGSAEQKP